MDETPAPVLNLGSGKPKKGYFWALAAMDALGMDLNRRA